MDYTASTQSFGDAGGFPNPGWKDVFFSSTGTLASENTFFLVSPPSLHIYHLILYTRDGLGKQAGMFY